MMSRIVSKNDVPYSKLGSDCDVMLPCFSVLILDIPTSLVLIHSTEPESMLDFFNGLLLLLISWLKLSK